MPKFSGIRFDNWQMASMYGSAGRARPFGVMRHRYEMDLSTHPEGTDVIYEIFEWDTHLDPIVLLYVSFWWSLDNTNFDNGEIGIGSDAGANNIIAAHPIDAAGNGTVIGNNVIDPGVTSLLSFVQGGVPHRHWRRPLSSYAGGDPTVGNPIKLNVVGSAAGTSDPISGYLYIHLLWASLRTT